MKRTFLVGVIALFLLSAVAAPAFAITSNPSVIAYDVGTDNYRK